MPPIPSHDVNDRPTEDSAGNHTNAISSSVGTPHITTSTTLSARREAADAAAPLRAPARLGGSGDDGHEVKIVFF